MSNYPTNPNQMGMIPFTNDHERLPDYLLEEDSSSTLYEQQTGAVVDRITQRDGGVIVDIGGVKSNPMMSIDVVVLDAKPSGADTYRAYYSGTYSEDEVSAPDCYSADGRVPSPNSTKPQCATCADCPKNVSGSGLNGQGRACGFFKHVAVAIYPELDRVYRLKVASRSLFSKDTNGVPSPLGGLAWGFRNFANLLQQAKRPWEAVVTRVSLPKGQTYGFFFTPVGYLTKEQFHKVKELQNSPAMHDILTVEVSGSVASNNATNPLNALPSPGTVQPTQPVQPVLTGREKWLADVSLPQVVKDWIVQVDDATAENYLKTNYPQVL